MIEYASQTKDAPLSRIPLDHDEPATLIEVYEQVVARHPKPDTLNYKSGGAWASVSAAEMLNRARHIAAGLHSLGVRKGDRVAILSDSRLEWVLADQGCVLLGAVAVPIYPTLTAAQVAYIVNDCAARAIFVANEEKLKQVQTALTNCASIQQVVLLDAGDPGILNLKSLEAAGSRALDESPDLLSRLAQE
ncbi:MAG TPA: AMP-binding protein, partial [Pyrinomonadaceae bacterium]|nr:AMP-binding protein [Pyrinomonadaceae bacterium]